MTVTPPEPDYSPQQDPGLPHEPPTIQVPAYQPSAFPPPSAYQPSVLPPPPDPSPQDLLGPVSPRKMSVLRIICGVIWGAITIILATGAVAEWRIGLHAAAVLCLVMAVGCGWYDYRVWTSKSRRLLLIL